MSYGLIWTLLLCILEKKLGKRCVNVALLNLETASLVMCHLSIIFLSAVSVS